MNFPGKSISTLGTMYQDLQDLEKRRYLEKTRPVDYVAPLYTTRDLPYIGKVREVSTYFKITPNYKTIDSFVNAELIRTQTPSTRNELIRQATEFKDENKQSRPIPAVMNPDGTMNKPSVTEREYDFYGADNVIRKYPLLKLSKVKITNNPITIGIPTEPWTVSPGMGLPIAPQKEISRITQEIMKHPPMLQLLSATYRNPTATHNWVLAVRDAVSYRGNARQKEVFNTIVGNTPYKI